MMGAAGEVDRGRAVHTLGLSGVGVELIARDELDAVNLPIDPLMLGSVAHLDRPSRFGRGFLRAGVDFDCIGRGPLYAGEVHAITEALDRVAGEIERS